MGAGNSAYVTSPVGFIVSWLLVLFGVAIVATITGALVGFLIDFLLKEGQGMGASGYRDHIVVCGWNSTARELIAELDGDDYDRKIVLIHEADKNPAGAGVYFVNGDVTNGDDLKRAGIEEAMAAVVCPADPTNEADMRSILAVMAIESIAPQVRTVVEVNNPAHVEHFRRAKADEIMVTSRIASRLLARSSLYPGLAELVTDIVSGGEGSELYRVNLPDDYIGQSIDELSTRLRAEHAATLLAIGRGGRAFVNPPPDFRLEIGDDALVVAESLGTLEPMDADYTETPPAERLEVVRGSSPTSAAASGRLRSPELARPAGVAAYDRALLLGLGPEAGLEVAHLLAQSLVGRRQDADGEQPGVAGAADRDGGHRYAGRHLHDGQQRVEPVELLERHRHPDDRQRRHRGEHAGQVGGPAGAGDDDTQPAARGLLAVGEHLLRHPMGGDHVGLEGDAELLQRLRGGLHHRPVGVGAHHDPDRWLTHVTDGGHSLSSPNSPANQAAACRARSRQSARSSP